MRVKILTKLYLGLVLSLTNTSQGIFDIHVGSVGQKDHGFKRPKVEFHLCLKLVVCLWLSHLTISKLQFPHL